MTPCEPPEGASALFFEARRLLLVLHAAGSVVLVGAATHHAWAMRRLLRGDASRAALTATWARIVAIAYAATFALGAALYPAYRLHVRALYLDRYAPGYAALFDVKETYAALTLVLALGLGAVGKGFARGATIAVPEGRALVRTYAAMSFLVCAVVWFNVVAGLLVTSVRGVG